MPLRIRVQPRARQRLDNLCTSDDPVEVAQGEALRAAAGRLADAPRPAAATPLGDESNGEIEIWSLRVGFYRIVYVIRGDTITIRNFRTGL
jgi:mRNA-degrading endonuclease RelE of RelBE toxin-antitoxin system